MTNTVQFTWGVFVLGRTPAQWRCLVCEWSAFDWKAILFWFVIRVYQQVCACSITSNRKIPNKKHVHKGPEHHSPASYSH